jgi:hypothetical protein
MRAPDLRVASPAALAMLLLFSAPSLRAATFKVGTAGACTHASLADALAAAAANGPGYDVIQISQDQIGNFEVLANAVGLAGGYADCDAASPTGTTVLAAPGSGRPLTIDGLSASYLVVELANLELTGGNANQGGGLRIEGRFVVFLDATTVDYNKADDGGGIYLDGGADAYLALQNGSTVSFNDATTSGGGIFCTFGAQGHKGNVTLVDGVLFGNTATYGGGIALDDCDLTSYAGGELQGIVGNSAADGGGVRARGGAQVRFFGGTDHPASIDSNFASAAGAAIRAEGPETRVELHDSWVTNNEGYAAIQTWDSAQLLVDRTLGSDCHSLVNCSRFANNEQGALWLTGDAAIYDTVFEDHATPEWLITTDGEGATVRFEGDLFDHNVGCCGGQSHTLVSSANDLLYVANSTFVDNLESSSDSIWSPWCVGCFPQTIEFVDNLVVEPPGIVVDQHGTPDFYSNFSGHFDCLIVNEVATLPSAPTATSLVYDPDLIYANRAIRDYRLKVDSKPVDYCDTSIYTPVAPDLMHQPRGYDDPVKSDLYGPYDLGAIEKRDLFSDGFESGDTRYWSDTVY